MPFCVLASAEAVSVAPEIDAFTPAGAAPSRRKVSFPWSAGSGSDARDARSSVDASSPGATFISAPTIVGGWLSGGSTVIGIVSVALRPVASSGPSPSVTSNVSASFPK